MIDVTARVALGYSSSCVNKSDRSVGQLEVK